MPQSQHYALSYTYLSAFFAMFAVEFTLLSGAKLLVLERLFLWCGDGNAFPLERLLLQKLSTFFRRLFTCVVFFNILATIASFFASAFSSTLAGIFLETRSEVPSSRRADAESLLFKSFGATFAMQCVALILCAVGSLAGASYCVFKIRRVSTLVRWHEKGGRSPEMGAKAELKLRKLNNIRNCIVASTVLVTLSYTLRAVYLCIFLIAGLSGNNPNCYDQCSSPCQPDDWILFT